MRLKHTDNFLRGGCLFCYRDNFSGLSNETMGAASYNFPAMDPAVHQLIATVQTYQSLLQRYADKLVNNKLVAALIVEAVIEDNMELLSNLPSKQIRSFLKTATSKKCEQWLLAKAKTLHLRKPKNPT